MDEGQFKRKGLALFENGWTVLPANGKAVEIKHWETIPVDRDRVERWAANGKGDMNTSIRTGLQPCGTFIALVDLDSYDKALSQALIDSFRRTFHFEPMVRIGQAPKLGLLVRLDKPSSKINSPVWRAPEHTKEKPMSCKVEVLAAGQQFVAYGIHPDTELPYRWQKSGDPTLCEPWELDIVPVEKLERWVFETVPTLIPPSWVKKGDGRARARELNPDLTDEEIDTFAVDRPLGRSVDEMRDVLMRLPEGYLEDHDDWIRIGQCIHHETAGSEEGLELWIEASKVAPNFEEGVCEERWKSFKTKRVGGVTWKTVEFLAKKPDLHTVNTSFQSVEDLREAMPRLQSQLMQMIPSERQITLRSLQREYSALLGSAVPLAALREELLTSIPSDGEDSPDMPEWASRHVWVHHENLYRSKTTKAKRSPGGFDVEFGRFRQDLRFINGAGLPYYLKPHAAFQRWGGEIADGIAYDPLVKDSVFRDADTGTRLFNLYNPRLRVKPDEKWTAAGLRFKAAYERHLQLLVPDSRHRSLLLSWWAYQYQFPGQKIMWSPVLIGCHGDGKNTFVDVFIVAVGAPNVTMISGTTVATSPFTGFVGMHQLCFVDEIYHPGDRHSVSEKMKGVIGAKRCELHMKGKDPIMVRNPTNFFFASNHDDCVAMQKTERRYFVLRSPIRTPDQLHQALKDLGTSKDEHFADLLDLARENPGQVAKFFSEIEIDPGFNPYSEAPRTEARENMIRFGVAEEESGLQSLLMNNDVAGVGPDVISINHLYDALDISEAQRSRRTRILKTTLNEAGYVEWRGGNNVLRWLNRSTRVWVKPAFASCNPDEVRKMLDATGSSPFDDDDDEEDF